MPSSEKKVNFLLENLLSIFIIQVQTINIQLIDLPEEEGGEGGEVKESEEEEEETLEEEEGF